MKQLHDLYKKILEEGYSYTDTSRDVNCKQISTHTLEFDLTKGFPAVTTKKLYWRKVVGELLWFLGGKTDIRELWEHGIHIWDKDWYRWQRSRKVTFVKRRGLKTTPDLFDLGRIYGAQWRKWKTTTEYNPQTQDFEFDGMDQFSTLIQNLKENPMSRRHIVTAWNPAELDNMALPPCHWSFEIIPEPLNDWICVDGKSKASTCDHPFCDKNPNFCSADFGSAVKYGFTLKWHQRSVDSFLGLPFNIASYALLAHIIGRLTNMIPKTLIGDLSNVHIYEPHIDAVKEQLTREEKPLPTLKFYDEISEGYFKVTDLDTIINRLKIEDFKLKKYRHHPAIKADMIAPKN